MNLTKLIESIYKDRKYWVGLCRNKLDSKFFAEDIFQQVVVILTEKLIEGSLSFEKISTEKGINKGFLSVVLRNECYNFNNRERKKHLAEKKGSAEEIEETGTDYRTIKEEIDIYLKEQSKVSKYADCQVQIFKVNMLEGVSLRDMQQKADIPYGTLFRIKKDLQNKIVDKFKPKYINEVADSRGIYSGLK